MQKLIIIPFILLIFIGIVFLYQNGSFKNITDPRMAITTGDIVELEGVLTDFDTECDIDGYCVAYVDDYQIITNMGEESNGTEVGKSDVGEDDIGKEVNVKAKVILGKKLSIYGSKDYYVLLK